jgi:RimJ/RimL family protein N-acetyltransferase
MTELTSVWPPFALTLTTPRLTLRPLRDDDIPHAVEAAASGIHDQGRNPFSTSWTEAPAGQLGPNMARWYWQCRANSAPESWTLTLGIWHDGSFLGCQDLSARDFSVLRTVTTGSWLQKNAQGRGFGKEMRAAAALYAFDWLGAEVCESEAAIWNTASLGVSRSLGYELNGVARMSWAGEPETVQRVRLTPEGLRRPDWELRVEGHEPTARFLLGVAAG